jgi:hypothetical protein
MMNSALEIVSPLEEATTEASRFVLALAVVVDAALERRLSLSAS